jgi:queuosine precursor transporter
MKQVEYSQKLDKPVKYLNILGVLYTSFLLVASLIVHKMVVIFGLTISASTLVFPFTYFLGDVIAEVYGYKVSRQLIWAAFAAMFIFDMLSAAIIHLPSPAYWSLQSAYDTVISPLPRIFLGDFLGLTIGAFLNVYLITKWKVMAHGRFFWLRSLCSAALGEAAFNIIAFMVVFIGVIPFNNIIQAMIFSYLFKVLFALISVVPALLLVRYLKNKECIDVYDYNTNFNPFTLKV